MADKAGVAFYGAGGIVLNRLAEGVELSEYARLVGAYNPSPENLDKLSAKYPGMRRYDSPDKLMADRNVDIVVVASPHHLHYEHALAALENGKNVWAEKPLATTYNGAVSLTRAAKDFELGLWVDSMMRNHWLNREAERIIQGKQLGRVISVETTMAFPYFDFNNFRYQELDEEGGGPLWDVGPHCLYMAMMLAGAKRIKDISASWGVQLDAGKPHQNCCLEYTLDNGVQAKSYVSFTTHWKSFMDNLFFRVELDGGYVEGRGTMFQHSATCKDNDQHLVVQEGTSRREIRTPTEGVPNIYTVEFDKLAIPIVVEGTLPIDRFSASLVGVIEQAIKSAHNYGIPRNTLHLFQP